ncbi:MAG: phage tail tape measure protein [Clostridium sp.]|nr:phage tail tape measure protein [Clostridium sp.]
MSNGGTISLTYLVNNDSFNSKIADMKKNLQLLQTEVKNSAKEIDIYGSNIQNLAKKQDTIKQAIKQTEKIMDSYNKQLEKNKTALSNNQSELDNLASKKKELNSQYKQAIKMYGAESEEAQKLKEQLSQTASEYDKMKGKVETNKSNIQNYTTQLERQRTTLLDLQGQLKQTNEEIEKQGNKFTEASQKFADYSGKLEKAGVKLEEIGEVAMTAGTAILAAATGLATMAVEMDQSLATLGGQLGTTSEETEKLKEIAINLYENGFGESIDDCINDVVLLQQNLRDIGHVTDEEKEKLLEYINNIKTLFGADTAEITKALNNMMNNGVISSYAEGLDLITVGFQNGLNSAGDFLDVLYEYSPQFKKLGLSGQDALEMIKAGLDAGGYNADKMADSLKELSIRAIDGSETTKQGFEAIGLNADEMAKKFAVGGDTAKEALQQVLDSLGNMEDPIKQDAAGVALFGTMWEDSSKQAILAMGDIGDGLGEITGATEKAGEEINNSIGTQMETVMRRLKDSLADMGKALLPAVESVAEGIEDLTKFISKLNPEVVKSIAKFGAMALAFGGVTKATGSLVTGIAKGASGLSKFLKIVADTKALGSFTKALAASETATGGLISSVGGLGKAFASLGAAGAIGGAIVAVGALGVAFMKLQDNLNKNTSEFKRAADSFDDFSGRVRTNKNLFTEIFGEEIEIKFSDNFEEEVGKAKDAIQSLQDKWDEYYNNVNGMSEEQKTKDLQALESQMIADQRMLKEKLSGNLELFGDYLRKNTDMTELEIGNQQGYYTEFFDQKLKDYQDNENAIFEIKRNAINEGRELSALELQQIDELEQKNAEIVAALSGNTEDIMTSFKAWYESQRVVIEADKAQKEAYSNSVIGAYQRLAQSIHDSFAQQETDILNNKNLTVDQKQVALDALHQREQAETDFTETFGRLMDEQIQSGKSNADASYNSMQKICEGLNNGTIDVEKYGMTANEYMAMAIGKMIEGGASADDLAAAIKAIPENKRADVLAKVSGKTESEELKRTIESLKDKNIYIRTYYETHGLSNANYHYENGVAVPNRETGGSVNESGIYNTQEAGLELIDTASPSQTAYSLAKATRGELTYIPANSKVTNAAMTTLKMKSMIDEEMKSMVNLYMAEFKKELLTIMKGNSGNGDFNVTMNNPSFVDKGSENANINNIKRIIKSMK